jgi:hypothetical protein
MSGWRSSRVWLVVALAGAAGAGALVGAERSSAAMAAAAAKFLGTLTPEQRQQAVFAFAADERTHWHFIPTETFPRKGLTVKDMNPAQRSAAHDLLRAGLSARGYLTATSIMDLEKVLNAIEAAQRQAPAPSRGGAPVEPFRRDPERYFFSVFGTPSSTDTWGWRVEGHHVSLQFTVVKGTLVASSPTFFGANPAEVREGPHKGLRVLGPQEDAARALLAALDPTQRQKAIITATAPNDIETMVKVEVSPLSPEGIAASALDANQRDLLMKLVEVYVGYMPADVAADRKARFEKADAGKIAFAWAGETERGKKHYYRVQGPTFLIEYDNSQNDGNHVHSVWRDFNGDFGRDLLREHLASSRH